MFTVGDSLSDPLMRPGPVVVHLVFTQDGAQMAFPEDQHAVQELTAQGTGELRELTAADVRQALSKMAAGYSSAAVTMGAPRPEARRPARRSQRPGGPQRRHPGGHPQGPGRPAIHVPDPGPGRGGHHRGPDPAGDGTAARPEGRPPAGQTHARLHRAQPAVRDPHRGSPGAALGAGGPGRRPGRQAAGAAARGGVAVSAGARRDQDRAVPPHPRPSPGGGPGAARLAGQPGRRAAGGRE